MISTRVAVPRAALAVALEAAGAPDLAEQVHARRLSVFDGGAPGEACLALTVDHVQDLVMFAVALADADPSQAAALANATQQDGSVAYWPGWFLVDGSGVPELTADQRTDARTAEMLAAEDGILTGSGAR